MIVAMKSILIFPFDHDFPSDRCLWFSNAQFLCSFTLFS